MGYTRTWSGCEIVKHNLAHIFYRHQSLGQLACVQPYRGTEVLNLFLAGKEYQHVPSVVTGMDLEEGAQSRFHKVWLANRCVKYMHLVLPSSNIDLFGAARIASVGPPTSSYKGYMYPPKKSLNPCASNVALMITTFNGFFGWSWSMDGPLRCCRICLRFARSTSVRNVLSCASSITMTP